MRKIVVLCCLMAVAGLAGAVEPTADPSLIAGSRVAPVFPPSALAARFDATVVLAVAINVDGSVGEIEVMESTRPSLGFEDAAIRAMKQWRFEPAMKDGEAVPSAIAYSLTFVVPPRRSTGSPYVSGFNMATSIGVAQNDSISALAGLNNEFKKKNYFDRDQVFQQRGYVGLRSRQHVDSGFKNGTPPPPDGRNGGTGGSGL